MPAPAEIPHADEALKTLVQRFKAAPGSTAFTELAAALLARGHAAEALRITEHGLQLVPGSVEGRVQRAAALLAQGRPRMAYVELKRALAIEPHHRRAQRLLGKAFVDAGAPERAAALLAQRSAGAGARSATTKPEPSSNLAAALVNDLTEEAPTATARLRPGVNEGSDLPALFSALTKDLGLGGAVPQTTPQRRVEVTQVIRRKARPRPPRSASELAEIEGPIVDTTQPTPSIDPEDEPAPTVTTREAAPLFSTNPDLASLSLDDEPLFQEHMPFAVRPVNAAAEELPLVEPQPFAQSDDPADAEGSRSPPARALRPPPRAETEPAGPVETTDPEVPDVRPRSERRTAGPALAGPGPEDPEARSERKSHRTGGPAFAGPRPGPEDQARAPTMPGGQRSEPRSAPRPDLRLERGPTVPTAGPDRPPTDAEPSEAPRYDGAGPIVERNRTSASGRLEIEAPPVNAGRYALAFVATVIMLAYFVGWIALFGDRLSVWWID